MFKYVLLGVSAIILLAVSVDADAIIGQNYKKALSYTNVVKGGKNTSKKTKTSGKDTAIKGEQQAKVKTIYMLSDRDETKKISSLKDDDVIQIHLPREKKNGSYINDWADVWKAVKYSLNGGYLQTVSSNTAESVKKTGFVGSCGSYASIYESDNGNKIMTLTYKQPAAVYQDNCDPVLQCWGSSCPENPTVTCLEGRSDEGSGSGSGGGFAIPDSNFDCVEGFSGCTCGKVRPEGCEEEAYIPPCKLHIGNKKSKSGQIINVVNKTIQIGDPAVVCSSDYKYECTGSNEYEPDSAQACLGKYAFCYCNGKRKWENGKCMNACSGFDYTCRSSGSDPYVDGGAGDSCVANFATYYKSCKCKSGYTWGAIPGMSGTIYYGCRSNNDDGNLGSGNDDGNSGSGS